MAAVDVQPSDHRPPFGARRDDLAVQPAGSVTERSTATIEPAGRIGCIASSISRVPIVCDGWGSQLPIGQHMTLDPRGVHDPAGDLREGVERDRHELRRLVAGQVLRGDDHDLARRPLQLLEAPTDQLDRRQLREQQILVGIPIPRALAVEQPRGVRPRLLDEASKTSAGTVTPVS